MRGRSNSFNLFLGDYDSSFPPKGDVFSKIATISTFDRKLKANRRKSKKISSVAFDKNYIPPTSKKTKIDVNFLHNAMKSSFLFADLDENGRKSIIDVMTEKSYSSNLQNFIAREGDVGDALFILKSGEIIESFGGNDTCTFTRGDVFGETFLIQSGPRVRSFRAKTDCDLFLLDRVNFYSMQAKSNDLAQSETIKLLKKQCFLKDLSQGDLAKLASRLTVEKYAEGEKILKKGEVGNSFFIVQEGTVLMHDIGFGESTHVDESLGPGDFFGGRALVTGDPRWMNCTATTDVSLLSITRKVCEGVIGNIQGKLQRSVKKIALLTIPIFANSCMQPFEIEELVDKMTDVTFSKGDIIKDHAMYIIYSGAIRVAYQNGQIFSFKSGDHFGGYNMLQLLRPNHLATVTEDSVCRKLTKDQVKDVIKDLSRLGKPIPPVSSRFDHSITLKDINKSRVIGIGGFGTVWLCTLKKDPKTPYALKTMVKKNMASEKAASSILREKNLLASVDHPFLVSITAAFQDKYLLYMFQEFLQGGELWSVVKEEYGIENKSAQFYAACVLDAISYLHRRSIFYRDLKPENVLIDSEGYGIVIDMGLSKVSDKTTFTMCGTPEYMAPEIILGKGHDQSVDFWAFGVLIYEMLVGDTPFYDNDDKNIFRKIVQVKYNIPARSVNDDAKDLIEKLLQKDNMGVRLGTAAGGAEDIRDHKWFDGVDWKAMREKKILAPWIPEVDDPLDSCNFEDYTDEENVDLTGQECTSEEQDYFKDF